MGNIVSQNVNMIDKKAVLDRIKKFYSLKGNADLARFLGVSPNTITNWYNRNTLDIDLIYTKCENMDLNWLLSGNDNSNKIGGGEVLKNNDLTFENSEKMGGDFGGNLGGIEKNANPISSISVEERAERRLEIIEQIENEDFEKSLNVYKKMDQLLRVNKFGKIDREIIDIQADLNICANYFWHYSITSQIHDVFVRYLKNETTKQELNDVLRKASDISKQVHQIAIRYKDMVRELYLEIEKINEEHDRLYCCDDLSNTDIK